jgi:hypothetical protein
MKEPEGLLGKSMFILEQLYILIFYIYGVPQLIKLIIEKGTPLINEMVMLGSVAIFYVVLLLWISPLKERVQRSVQQGKTKKMYMTLMLMYMTLVISWVVTWVGMIILIGLLWLGLPLFSEKWCLQLAQQIHWYFFLPLLFALSAVISAWFYLKRTECLYVVKLRDFLFSKNLKRVVIIAAREDEQEAHEFEECLKEHKIEASVVSSCQRAKDPEKEFIVIVYKKHHDNDWLNAQLGLCQKKFFKKDNILIIDDDFFKSFEVFTNKGEKDEMVLLKYHPKVSNLGE